MSNEPNRLLRGRFTRSDIHVSSITSSRPQPLSAETVRYSSQSTEGIQEHHHEDVAVRRGKLEGASRRGQSSECHAAAPTDYHDKSIESLYRSEVMEERPREPIIQIPGGRVRGSNIAYKTRSASPTTSFVGLQPCHEPLRPFTVARMRSMLIRPRSRSGPGLANDGRPSKPPKSLPATSVPEVLQYLASTSKYAAGKVRCIRPEDVADYGQMGIWLTDSFVLDLYGVPASICQTDRGWVAISEDCTSYAFLGKSKDDLKNAMWHVHYSTWEWRCAESPGGVVNG